MATSMTLCHATTLKAARGIEETNFRPGNPGKRRYAGAAIYFAAERENAIKHCFNGVKGDKNKKAEVVICCKVDLGNCPSVVRHTVDENDCAARGYDSVHVLGTDTYAVYDAARIHIQEFERIDGVSWRPACGGTRRRDTAVPEDSDSDMAPEDILIAAIAMSPSRALNVTHDIAQLYTKHPALRTSVRAAGGLKRFCEAHRGLKFDGFAITVSRQSESLHAERDTDAQQMRNQARREAGNATHRNSTESQQQLPRLLSAIAAPKARRQLQEGVARQANPAEPQHTSGPQRYAAARECSFAAEVARQQMQKPAQQARNVKDLPLVWERKWSDVNQREFYFNRQTGVSTWKLPAEYGACSPSTGADDARPSARQAHQLQPIRTPSGLDLMSIICSNIASAFRYIVNDW